MVQFHPQGDQQGQHSDGGDGQLHHPQQAAEEILNPAIVSDKLLILFLQLGIVGYRQMVHGNFLPAVKIVSLYTMLREIERKNFRFFQIFYLEKWAFMSLRAWFTSCSSSRADIRSTPLPRLDS